MPKLSSSVGTKVPQTRTAVATVNEWIAETRRKRFDADNSSRATIAGWVADARM